MKKIQLLTILLSLSVFAFAQTPYNMQWGSYTQNFNSLASTGTTNTNFPSGWGLYETDNNANNEYRAGAGTSTTGDTYSFGAANSSDRALGGLLSGSLAPSYGFGFVNNTGYNLVSVDLSATMEQWRASNSASIDSCNFYYSTDATGLADITATWNAVPNLDLYSAVNPTSTSSLDGNLSVNQINLNGTISVSIPMGDTIFFKWVDIDIPGSDDGLAIDDLSLVLNDVNGPIPAGPPTLLSTVPADNATNVPLSTTSISFTLDQAITSLGTGNARLTNMTAMSSVNIPIGSITYTGSTATLAGISLISNNDYSVQIDSGLFISANGAFLGIKDSTTWNFKAENTTPPPAVTSLNETFTGCMDPLFGVFKDYSEVGGQDWRCTTFGHNDTNAVRMNGFAGGPQDNLDWLISPPLDFSGMTAPNLHFWSKLRFPAATVKELLVSTNYNGIGNPTAATWNAVQVNNWSALDTTWRQFTNTDLTTYKSSNFHIAFRYESDTVNADEWSLDDILVTDGPLSIGTFANNDLAFVVVGDVTHNLTLQSTSKNDRMLSYTMHDMAGRVVNSGNMRVVHGKQIHDLDARALNSGMYILNITDGKARSAVKFIVR